MDVRCKAAIALIACALCVASADAADAPAGTADSSRHDARRLGRDLGSDGLLTLQNGAHYLAAPRRWTFDAWAAGMMAAASVGILAMLDEPVRSGVQTRRTTAQDRLIDPLELYGSTAVSTSLAGGIYLCGLFSCSAEIRETGRSALVSLAFASGVTRILKIGIGRARPYLDEGYSSFTSCAFDGGHHSFPSGHTTAAFAVSSALSLRLRNGWAAAGLYALAATVAAQRIHSDRHWLSDTMAGAVIGTATGIFVVRDSERQRMNRGRRIALVPVYAPDRQGIAVALSL